MTEQTEVPTTDQMSKILADVALNQIQMQTTLDAILAKFDEVANEIKPLIDQLSNHPMAKMLGLKK